MTVPYLSGAAVRLTTDNTSRERAILFISCVSIYIVVRYIVTGQIDSAAKVPATPGDLPKRYNADSNRNPRPGKEACRVRLDAP